MPLQCGHVCNDHLDVASFSMHLLVPSSVCHSWPSPPYPQGARRGRAPHKPSTARTSHNTIARTHAARKRRAPHTTDPGRVHTLCAFPNTTTCLDASLRLAMQSAKGFRLWTTLEFLPESAQILRHQLVLNHFLFLGYSHLVWQSQPSRKFNQKGTLRSGSQRTHLHTYTCHRFSVYSGHFL